MQIFKYIFIAKKLTTGKSKLINVATIVSIISIVLGNIALILSLSVLDGFDIKLHEIATKFTSHISASSFNKKTLKGEVEVKSLLLSKYNSTQDNFKINRIQISIQKEALIRANEIVDGVVVKGIKSSDDIANLKQYFKKGANTFSSIDAKEIFLSERLANKLNLKLNDKVILFSIINNENSNIPDSKVKQFILKGIFSTGFATWDDVLVIIPFTQAADIFDIPQNEFTTLEIQLSKNSSNSNEGFSQFTQADKDVINNMALEMEKLIGYPFYFQTVYDFHRAIFNWIDLQKEPIPIVLGLISLVAALNISTALIIAVVEKTNTLGILRTMGLSKKDIRFIFAIRGLLIGLIGSAIGLSTSFFICWLQVKFQFFKLNAGVHFLDTVPVSININDYYLVLILTLFLSVIASIIPSIFATRISPLKAIVFK